MGLRDTHPELPWRSIVGLRNVLAYDYGEIDAAPVFAVAVRDIPPLFAALEPLLPLEP